MRCPHCDSEIVDEQAVFCPRCGGTLGSSEVEVTEKLQVPEAVAAPDDAAETDELESSRVTDEVMPDEPAPESPTSESPAPVAAVRDLTESVRRSFVSRWLDATAAACLGFLVLLCVGAVLLVAAKLQFPGFGTGANPIEVLTAVTILGLAVLRTPIHFGNLLVTTLPFGALIAAGAGIAWATRVATKDRPPADMMERALVGVRVAVPFGLVCWLAALVFRFRGGDEVFAGAWGALFWGAVWGGVFGVMGAATSGRELLARLKEMTIAPEGPVRRGLSAGIVMLATALGLAAAATLIGIIVALARGAPRPGFGAGDAAAAIVYLVAFAPNVLVAMTALGLGSALDVGARVTVAGGRLGSVRELSLFAWGGQDGPPGVAYLLVLIPLIATMLGGFYARRRGGGSIAIVLGVATAVFALVLFGVALLGDARLGGGLAGRGVAHVSVHAFRTLGMALVWGAAGGFLGWKAAEIRRGPG